MQSPVKKLTSDIARKLSDITKMVAKTGATGKVDLVYKDVPVSVFDEAVASIKGYARHNETQVIITSSFTVRLIID